MTEHRGFLGWVSSIFRIFPPIRRVASGGFTQPKVLLIGDEKVGKSAFLRLIGMKQLQPLKTWEPRSVAGNSVQIAHKEDRTATYIEEAELTKPFPIFSLTTTDVVIFCFSLVDRLTWSSVLTGLDAVHKEDIKTKTYHPVIIVGLKADLRDEHMKKLKQEQQEQQRARQAGASGSVKEDSSGAKYWTPSEHPQWNASAMPVDVLLRIYSFLPTRDLVSATLVCSQWAQVAKHPYNWSSRARGFLTAKQARDHLRSDALRKWPILYFELNAKDQKDVWPAQQAIYQIVVAVATNTRALPPAILKQIDEDASTGSTTSASSIPTSTPASMASTPPPTTSAT